MIRRPILFVLCLLALPVWGAAQDPQVAKPPATKAATPAVIGPAKIAFVNIQQVVATCEEGKREDASLQQYISVKSEELQKMQKEVETLKNTYDIQGTKLTDEARQDLLQQIDAKDTQLQRFQEDTQKDIDNRRQRWQNTIARKIIDVINKIAKEKDLSWVKFIDPNQDGYINESLIITDEVIKAYNEAHPVPTPAIKK
jgi:Skp family chaperone for outer membrane proteins